MIVSHEDKTRVYGQITVVPIGGNIRRRGCITVLTRIHWLYTKKYINIQLGRVGWSAEQYTSSKSEDILLHMFNSGNVGEVTENTKQDTICLRLNNQLIEYNTYKQLGNVCNLQRNVYTIQCLATDPQCLRV